MGNMAGVTITGWRSGLQKITMTKLIREYTGLSLRDSKACTDGVLAGEIIVLTLETQERAEQLAARLQSIGAVAEAA